MAQAEHYLVDNHEVVVTSDMHVRCDGGNAGLGHPVEFLTLEKGGETVCKYCGRRYVHVNHPDAGAIRELGKPHVNAY